MADRFKSLNSSSTGKKQEQKTSNRSNTNSSHENIFKSKEVGTREKRNITGKSLKELATTTYKPNSKGKNGQKNKNNLNHNHNHNHNRRSNFKNEFKEQKKEFDIKNCEFPTLVKDTDKSNRETESDIDYKKRVETSNLEESKEVVNILPKGWILLTKGKQYEKKYEKKIEPEDEISEYYNPIGAQKIMEERIKHREELNDILGDMSPYWNMDYIVNLEQEEEEYANNSEYDSEDEEEYVEDW